MSPKLVEVDRHPNIEILTNTQVERVVGETGDFTATLSITPRYIDEEQCTGCGVCVEYCPVKYPDVFNQEISMNKAVHIYFAQAIPLVAYIDESCLYLKEKKCRICQGVCKNNAINLNQLPEKREVKVGAIILASGIKPFDPKTKPEYHYGDFTNVVTSMDYERLLCATGPYQGEVLRTSDLKHPRKVAWIQCVGSRQVTENAHSYCSSVCCTYSQKQVILTKDHDPEAECVIFHNDIRSFGKDFERYFERTDQYPGVRFIRSYVSIVSEDPVTKNVTIKYSTLEDGVIEEEFEMVVLSVGLTPPAEFKDLAETFGVELDAHGFCQTDLTNPMETSRPGVYVSGGFRGPIDIPEAVFSASGAGSLIGETLGARRGDLSTERVYPPEIDLSGEAPKIGVFVCHCGANIGRIIDVPSMVDYSLTLPDVVYAQEQTFSCATNSAKEITDMITEKGLNRVVIAACTPRTLEPLFRDTLREAGINQYYLEMANIREHNSWVHAKEKEEAIAKARDTIRMSIARVRHLEPLQEFELPVNKAALVVGGGLAGMTTALSIANQGHHVHLLEKDTSLGGMAKRIHTTLDGLDVQELLVDLSNKVFRHPLIHLYFKAEVLEVDGYVGSFVAKVKSDRGIAEIKHGAAVVAIGAELYTPEPSEYFYGEDDRVMTHLDLDGLINGEPEKLADVESVAMIQCVGCRNEDRSYCSRICCSESIKNALHLKKINPKMDVYVFFRDIRTYGFNEDYYREAAGQGVVFIRYEEDAKPTVEAGTSEEGKDVLKVTAPDYVLDKQIEIDADLVVLAAAVIPTAEAEKLAGMYKVSTDMDGFFKEAHAKLRPVEFGTEGVYLCGTAHYPKFIKETIAQAYGAAGRVITLLSKDIVLASGSVCAVDEDKCVSCGACITVCSYNALDFYATPGGRKVRVNSVLCKGDGLCNAKCPTEAISLKHYTKETLESQIEAAFDSIPVGR